LPREQGPTTLGEQGPITLGEQGPTLLRAMRFFDYGFGHLEPGSRLGPARWPYFDLLAVHAGSLEMTIAAAEPATISAGDALLLFPDTPFHGQCVERCQFSVQHFELPDSTNPGVFPALFAALLPCRSGFERYRFACPGPLERDIERAVRLALTDQTDAIHELRVAQLMLLLGELTARVPGLRARVAAEWQPLLEWIETHLSKPVSLAQMARVMDMSTSRFRARFREEFGMPPGQYVKQRRLEESCRLLRETSLPIKTIAHRAGYRELPNFYRAFRQTTDLSPAEYRRRWSVEL
jgi:AraC-like DNA-binding protein